MKALRKLSPGPGHVDVVEVAAPKPGKEEVVVNVEYAGICGTDIHIFHGLFPKVRPPVTLGHEFCGTVWELGDEVEEWQVGDRVTVESAASFCGMCEFCKAGQTQRCRERKAFGYAGDGAFTNLVAARRDALHRLPDYVDFQEGALSEPLACATHAVMERSSLKPGMTALVTGPGTIGLLVLQVVKELGAKVIITGTERDAERLRIASELGGHACLQADSQKLFPTIHEVMGKHGVDVAYECSGAPGALNDCVQFLKAGGELVQVGLFGRSIPIDYDQVALKEIQVTGSFAHNRGSWEKAIRLLRDRKINMRPLISGVFPLTEWQEAFRLFEEGTGLKYLLRPMG